MQTPYGLSGGFTPAITTVPVGSQFHFTNTDSFAHTGSYLGSVHAVPHRLAASERRDDAERHYALGRIHQRRPTGGHVVADDHRRPGGHVSVWLLLPLWRADAGGDHCAVTSRPPGLRCSSSCWPARRHARFRSSRNATTSSAANATASSRSSMRSGVIFARMATGCRCPSTERRSSHCATSWNTTSIRQPARASSHPAASFLGSGNIGPITAYLHYGLGAGGGPGGVFLLFAAAL